jgi:hypothetical protein
VRRTPLNACYGRNRWKAGPAQPSPTIAQCLNGGYAGLMSLQTLPDPRQPTARRDPASPQYADLET